MCIRDRCLGYYGSRIYYGEEADNEVILVEFRNAEQKTVAVLCNWATHSTVLDPENDLLKMCIRDRTIIVYNSRDNNVEHLQFMSRFIARLMHSDELIFTFERMTDYEIVRRVLEESE